MAKATGGGDGFQPGDSEASVTSQEVSQRATTPLSLLTTETMQIGSVPNCLPIGYFDKDGNRHTSFTVKEYDGVEELALSKICSKARDQITTTLPAFCARIVKDIGGISIEQLAKEQEVSTHRFFEQMYLADILTILLQIRIDNYGNDILIQGKCPNCSYLNKDSKEDPTDLGTTETELIRDLSCGCFEVELSRGAQLFDDLVKRVQMVPPRLCDMKRISKQKDDKLKLYHELLMNTVVGMPESSAYGSTINADRTGLAPTAVEALYKKLSARDRDLLIEAVGKLSRIGPALTIEMNCQNCGNEGWTVEVPWRDLLTFLRFSTQ